MAVSEALRLTAAQRIELQANLRKQNLPASIAQRMRIILALADGLSYREIMDNLGTTAPTISLWKRRLLAEGVIGLGTIRPGQPAKLLTPELTRQDLSQDL